MTLAHVLGFPRIGIRRELKLALEAYWKDGSNRTLLLETARALRLRHWQLQKQMELDQMPVGDFSLYDHVLDHSVMFGAVPERFGVAEGDIDLDTYFRMARGQAPSGAPAQACEMTKWFDTNYHYLVPELHRGQRFRLASARLFDEVEEAKTAGVNPRPVLLGPLSWLWLGKVKGEDFDRLDLLDELLPVYREILVRLKRQGIEWVQMDEPILVLDLPSAWQAAFAYVYAGLSGERPKLLLATYFGALEENLKPACELPIEGLHLDLVRAPQQLRAAVEWLPGDKVFSAGVIDGRNVWRADLGAVLDVLEPLHARLGERLWIGPSCSLLHVPVDLSGEEGLNQELRTWLAFATQKLTEVATLRCAVVEGRAAVADRLADSDSAARTRRTSERSHRRDVRDRVAAVDAGMGERRSAYCERAKIQGKKFRLPLFPTTTIGSFPQTGEIRAARRDFKLGRMAYDAYAASLRQQVAYAVQKQEECGLDVLVHGEPERNDMVEYFGEQLDGFAFTGNGWVQSYGSRCVKPPILYGDVARPKMMTIEWTRYAQSLTKKPMKGMLTGPVTLLNWSFVRNDQPRADTCMQLALAIRDEVLDLERAGIGIIQIDEPALREGLPLHKLQWGTYLDWTITAFRIAANGVRDETQIHTHMCYAEFNDIIGAIAALDADVITIETSRSDMELLKVFEHFKYPNAIGPGVYDIHSPNVPTVAQMVGLMEKAAERIPVERLWVNPDCGLKTRSWPEAEAALANMAMAAAALREKQERLGNPAIC